MNVTALDEAVRRFKPMIRSARRCEANRCGCWCLTSQNERLICEEYKRVVGDLAKAAAVKALAS